jgi:putative glutamine amidotransferase
MTGAPEAEPGFPQRLKFYIAAIEGAGAQWFAIRGTQELADAAGLLLTGGGDVAPRRYGREPHPRLGAVDEERDELELALASEGVRRDLPVLAICRGLQLLIVSRGGTLWQDLPSELPGGVEHGRGAGPVASSERARHRVVLLPGSVAAAAAGAVEIEVNSSHHQAAQVVEGGLIISGWAPDGIVEAVEMPGARFVLGVQWHPEEMLDEAEHARRLFSAYVETARGA